MPLGFYCKNTKVSVRTRELNPSTSCIYRLRDHISAHRLSADQKSLLEPLARRHQVQTRSRPRSGLKTRAELEPVLSELQLIGFIWEQLVVGNAECISKHVVTHESRLRLVLNERSRALDKSAWLEIGI